MPYRPRPVAKIGFGQVLCVRRWKFLHMIDGSTTPPKLVQRTHLVKYDWEVRILSYWDLILFHSTLSTVSYLKITSRMWSILDTMGTWGDAFTPLANSTCSTKWNFRLMLQYCVLNLFPGVRNWAHFCWAADDREKWTSCSVFINVYALGRLFCQ